MTDPQRPGIDPAADTTVTPTPTPGTMSTAPEAAPPTTPADPAAPLTPATAVPTTQVATASSAGQSRGRWTIAAAVVGAVAIGTAAVAFALTAAAPAATVAGYVPAGSVAYGEVRLDFPGDQREAVGEFLSHFPGFADQAALDSKIDEVLDRLISEATEGQQSFTGDIKPWFDGELAFAVGALPDAPAVDDPAAAARDSKAVVLLSVKDEALARTWFDGVLAEIGVTPTTETYNGTELKSWVEPETGTGSGYALIGGKVLAIGTVDGVKAAIDTGGDSTFSDDPEVKAAFEATEGDHIGFVFIDLGSLMASANEVLGEEGGAVANIAAGLVPDWASFTMRVEGDAVVLDGAMPNVEAAPGPQENSENDVAAWAPPSTIVLASGNDYGQTLDGLIDQYQDDPAFKELFDGIEGAAGMLGGLDGIYGWLGDTGLVVSAGAEAPEGGIISIPSDPEAAQQFFTTLKSLAALAGGQAGIELREEDHNGTTITIVDLGDLSQLAGMAGALGGEAIPSEVPLGELPFDGDVELAYAATDDVVVIGSGPAFVRSVLDAGAGESLADDDRFSGLLERAGTQNTGVTFVDIAAARTHIEGMLGEATAEERAEYEESIKPFLEPLDAFIATSVAGSDVDTTHAFITVQ